VPDALASAALVLVAAAGFWGLFQLRVYFTVGGGYKAKVLCTAIFGSLRDLDPQRAEQVYADSYWMLRPFAVRVDRTARTVTTSCLGFRRVAVHRDGLGATLLSGRAAAATLGPVLVRRDPSPGTAATRGTGAVGRIVDAAFDEPDPRRPRRTYAVVVVQDGRIIAERYAPGITAETPLPGWSMTKSILSALVGILVERGTLALDARELLPAWRAPDPRAAITLEDLLRMRSGLRFSEVYANPWSDVLHMLYNCADTAAYAAARPLSAAPGTQWSYSSGTTNILSRIVRQAVGDGAYHAWPRQVLFDPIGMTSAVLEPDASGTFVCSSYGLATARDWARYGQLWLDGGRCDGQTVLPEWWTRFCTTPTPQSDGRYGAHWWLKLNPDIGGDTDDARAIAPDAFFAVGHEGQTLTIVPSRRLVVVRLGAAIYIDAWNQAQFIAALQDALDRRA
jgi:CubicO group peptidase (beta-lactamase class C family)